MTQFDTTDWPAYRRLIDRNVAIDVADWHWSRSSVRRVTRFGVVSSVEIVWPTVTAPAIETWRMDLDAAEEPTAPELVTIRFDDHSSVTFTPALSEVTIDY